MLAFKKITKKSNTQSGMIIVEAAMAMIWYGLLFVFLLYIYEYLEANQESQIVAGVKLREQMLGEISNCYSTVEQEFEGEVGVQYKLKPFFNEDSMPINIKKIGYAGPCPRPRESRFDRSNYREPRSPEGFRQGNWLSSDVPSLAEQDGTLQCLNSCWQGKGQRDQAIEQRYQTHMNRCNQGWYDDERGGYYQCKRDAENTRRYSLRSSNITYGNCSGGCTN